MLTFVIMDYLTMVQQQRDLFLEKAAENRLPKDLKRIKQAYEYANKAHENQERK